MTFCPKYPKFWVKKAHDMRVPKVLLPPPLKLDFWPKEQPNLAQNWHFLPNIGIFGKFDLLPDQKTMRTSCTCVFFIMWVTKLLLTPVKIRIFGQKMANFGPNYAFLVILGKILAFFAHFVPCLTKKQC